MNFIEHFRGWISRAETDTRLKSHHISLYIALFRYWNENRFANPFTIFRHEIMALSKIGSVTTYTRSLRELTEWSYIRYEPSFDPQVGSRVYLYRFDKGAEQGSAPGAGQGRGQATDQAGDTYTINNTNPPNLKNNLNIEGTSHEPSDVVRGRPATPRSLEEAQAYFLEIHSTAAEAEKFFNHFQSNGWRVGGRSPMKDWRAAARNWVINAQKFNHEHTHQPKPGKLETGPKNYAEPL
jgi:hypothetical protein